MKKGHLQWNRYERIVIYDDAVLDSSISAACPGTQEFSIFFYFYHDGVGCPHTPIAINAAAPDGAPPRRLRTVLISVKRIWQIFVNLFITL
jgi:hypothetical protein